MSQTDQQIKDTAALLEQSGLPASDAFEIAHEAVQESQTMKAGAKYNGLQACDLTSLWNVAASGGATRLVLEINRSRTTNWFEIHVTILERDGSL